MLPAKQIMNVKAAITYGKCVRNWLGGVPIHLLYLSVDIAPKARLTKANIAKHPLNINVETVKIKRAVNLFNLEGVFEETVVSLMELFSVISGNLFS